MTLAVAYRRSVYRGQGWCVRIGRRSAAMDALLRRHGVRYAALVSADNPYSRRMPDGWNARMRRVLAQAVGRGVALPATGGWRRWSEDHLLLLGGPGRALVVGRRFRQNAIVVVALRQPARLVLLRT